MSVRETYRAQGVILPPPAFTFNPDYVHLSGDRGHEIIHLHVYVLWSLLFKNREFNTTIANGAVVSRRK